MIHEKDIQAFITDFIDHVAGLMEKYPLYSQDGKKGEAVVIAKYFLPGTAATWYITEGEFTGVGTEEEDITFFGITEGLDEYPEAGYFTLRQLLALSQNTPVEDVDTGEEIGTLTNIVERDRAFKPSPLKEVLPEYVRRIWKEG